MAIGFGKIRNNNEYSGRKDIVHALRYMLFAMQLVEKVLERICHFQ
jgi:hypothetical protein